MDQLIILVAKYFIVIPPLALLYIFWKLPKNKRREALILTAISGIVAFICIKIGAALHQDPRPFMRDGIKPLIASATDNGFPSDHVALSAFLAFIAMRYSHRIGSALLLLALLIGTCRVAAGVHHGQDVVGGIIFAGIGVLAGLLIVKLTNNLTLKKRSNEQKED